MPLVIAILHVMDLLAEVGKLHVSMVRRAGRCKKAVRLSENRLTANPHLLA